MASANNTLHNYYEADDDEEENDPDYELSGGDDDEEYYDDDNDDYDRRGADADEANTAAVDGEVVSDSDVETVYEEDSDSEAETIGEPDVVVDDDGFHAMASPPRDAEVAEAPAAMDVDGEDGCRETISRVDADRSLSPNCPICFEPWTSQGPHRVCCIPCGHVYGRSCIEKWVQKCDRSHVKCPHCNRKFTKTRIINLYAPLIGVRDDNLDKELHSLREKNLLLNLEKERLVEELNQHKKHQISSETSERQKRAHLEDASPRLAQMWVSDHSNYRFSSVPLSENSLLSQNIRGEFCNYRFILEREVRVDGARALGIDASSQILVVARKTSGVGEHVLSKISMLSSYETDRIQLPANTGAVRDLCILPGNLVLLASLGKTLSLISSESKHLILKYDLPVPAWSCVFDFCSPYYVYAGLQNGMLMLFDLRQTAKEVKSIMGLSRHPIHTIHSLQNDSARKVLTASSLGPCIWDVDGERPSLLPGIENEGVCLSLAYSNISNNLVASFRPKVEASNDGTGSQYSALSTVASGMGKLGSHILLSRDNSMSFKRHEVGYGYVSDVRMSKSAIVDIGFNSPLFAYGDESTHGVSLLSLPSFSVHAHLQPHQHSILDLKYVNSAGHVLLGCVSDDRLQLYSGRGI